MGGGKVGAWKRDIGWADRRAEDWRKERKREGIKR